MALEDTVVVSISHEDLRWVGIDIPQIDMVISKLYMYYSEIFGRVEASDGHVPENKYDNLHRGTDFNLERVPDVYLASYLNISLKELKELRKGKV